MTPKAYQEARKALGSQDCVARRLGVAKSTIQRREHGEQVIDREAELAIHTLRAFNVFATIFKVPKQK